MQLVIAQVDDEVIEDIDKRIVRLRTLAVELEYLAVSVLDDARGRVPRSSGALAASLFSEASASSLTYGATARHASYVPTFLVEPSDPRILAAIDHYLATGEPRGLFAG